MKIIILLIAFFGSAILTHSGLKSVYGLPSQVLGDNVQLTLPGSPTTTLSPTVFVTESPTPKPTLTLIPTTTVSLQPEFTSEQINGFIERFAGQFGVDPNVLRAIAICESGFNSKAVNGKYFGLYQFDSTSWKNNRIKMGEDTNTDLRFNAEEAVQTAAYVISTGKRNIWPNCNP